MSFRRRVPVVVAASLASGLLLSPGVRGAGTEKSGGGITNVQGGPSTFTGTNSSQVVKVTQFGTGEGIFAAAIGSGRGVHGHSNSSDGVFGYSYNSNGVRGYGYYGNGVRGDSSYSFGVFGSSLRYAGVYGSGPTGVYGRASTLTGVGGSFVGGKYGIFASGTTDAAYFSGSTYATGTKSAVVPLTKDSAAAVYVLESPEVWFEDFGSAQLLGGAAHVGFDRKFLMTVSTKGGYKVFLTPKGDCKGLYVAQETTGGFDVRELGGGTSTLSFDYKIVAHRKGYETVRMKEFKADEKSIAAMQELARRPGMARLPALDRAEARAQAQARREAHMAQRPATAEERQALRRGRQNN